MHLSHVPWCTTFGQKFAHFFPKVVYCGIWDRCIKGFDRSVYYNVFVQERFICTCLVLCGMVSSPPAWCYLQEVPSGPVWPLAQLLQDQEEIRRTRLIEVSLGSVAPPQNGLLTIWIKLWVVHMLGMPGTFPLHRLQRKPLVGNPVHDARAVMHVGIANPWWWWKRSWHSWHMRNPQFYVSGQRPKRPWKHWPCTCQIRYTRSMD